MQLDITLPEETLERSRAAQLDAWLKTVQATAVPPDTEDEDDDDLEEEDEGIDEDAIE